MSRLLFTLACLLGGFLAPVVSGKAPEKDVPPPKPPTFQAPKDWKAVDAALPLISASFQIGEGDRIAKVTVTGLAGDAGGLVANVNRWRQQVGLESVAEKDVLASLKPIKVDGLAAHYVDLTGPDVPNKATQRILGVVVKRGEQTWFFKLMGPASVAGTQVEAFDGFIKSVRFEK